MATINNSYEDFLERAATTDWIPVDDDIDDTLYDTICDELTI